MSVSTATTDAASTIQVGERFAQALRLGDVIVLSGDLGAGKTTFTQGVAKGLGVEQAMTSPTFVLAREHRIPSGGRFVHADAYRLDSLEELADMAEDVYGDDAITVVEWGNVVAAGLGPISFVVKLRADGQDPDAREIEFDCLDSMRADDVRNLIGVTP